MKALKIATILPLLLLVSGVLWAATQYGEATIEKGSMTIIREGHTLQFSEVNRPVPVNELDLIRVRDNSSVVLKSRENATMTLGANAVFQVKQWRKREKQGFVRALFGRFRAAIVGLTGGEQFNVKTATATIGVKGTKYRTQVTSRGGTMLIVTHHIVGLHGQRGTEVNVNTGQLSLVVNVNPATPPAPVPPEVGKKFGDDDLNSPPPNSNTAQDFAGEDGLKRAGIVNDDDLDSGKGDGYVPPPPPDVPEVDVDVNAASEALRRARVRLSF